MVSVICGNAGISTGFFLTVHVKQHADTAHIGVSAAVKSQRARDFSLTRRRVHLKRKEKTPEQFTLAYWDEFLKTQSETDWLIHQISSL